MTMETNQASLQAEFLDLRHTLSEVAGSAYTAVLAALLTLYALARAASLYTFYTVNGLYACVPSALVTLLCLFTAVVLWIAYAQGRKAFLKPWLLKALRAMPIAETVVAVMVSLVMIAACIVVIFSNETVLDGLDQLYESVAANGALPFTAELVGSLGSLAMGILTAVTVAATVLLLLVTLRYCLLAGVLARVCSMEKRNAAQRSGISYVYVMSFLMGLFLLLTGVCMARTSPLPALCTALYGATLFANGLLLYKLAKELNFLYTYYLKLNRAAQRRAAGIKASEAALKNAPLMLPSMAHKAENVDDLPAAADAPDVIHAEAAADAPGAAPDDTPAEEQEPAAAPAGTADAPTEATDEAIDEAASESIPEEA